MLRLGYFGNGSRNCQQIRMKSVHPVPPMVLGRKIPREKEKLLAKFGTCDSFQCRSFLRNQRKTRCHPISTRKHSQVCRPAEHFSHTIGTAMHFSFCARRIRSEKPFSPAGEASMAACSASRWGGRTSLARIGRTHLLPVAFDATWPQDYQTYRLTLGQWPETNERRMRGYHQTTRRGLVLRLNITASHNRQMSRLTHTDLEEYNDWSLHPIERKGNLTLAWSGFRYRRGIDRRDLERLDSGCLYVSNGAWPQRAREAIPSIQCSSDEAPSEDPGRGDAARDDLVSRRGNRNPQPLLSNCEFRQHTEAHGSESATAFTLF